MPIHKVRVTVNKVVKGKCPQGHVPGQTWLMEEKKTPGGMCTSAYCAIYPLIFMFRFGGVPNWLEDKEDKDVQYLCCPDPERLVVFEIRRLSGEEGSSV